MNKPKLSFWQIWNMSFGFFGIQFGWGLQMANMSAIYQYLGADESTIPFLWLAAPLTGLIVQPLVGYYSDRTWTRLGRRRPYFLVGAILASLSLIAMPNSSSLWMAAGLLWILDASVNISMEPFRAFVGDKLNKKQRKLGFAMQSLLIGLGAVLSSSLPWMLSNWFGVTNAEGATGAIPQTVKIAFYVGSGVFFAAVLYTILSTKEYPPEDMEAFEQMKRESAGVGNAFKEIFEGIGSMPKAMKQLAVVQFFTWFGLFCMWIYFIPAVATHIFGGTDHGSEAYQAGAEWGGVCFSVYNGVAFFFAFLLLLIVRKFSAKGIHTTCLAIGALGLLSVAFVGDAKLLLASMVCVGIAWASILSMPYAMLANVIPGSRMGFYMGVFNFFIVLPQIAASLGLGYVMASLLGGNTMNAVLLGGASMLIAAFCVRFVDDDESVDGAAVSLED
ncbi:MAG TPA: MFS transporter [Opitutae bacterium]|nr:MFS transporter [Puniceicoccaceae bacterium]HBR94136.1 MFS transporter [Opitutae bacterium]|tara:strand:+ start:19718 stop:21052 length:1335 start_codon:yes stop_codon:yes gene_type:complete